MDIVLKTPGAVIRLCFQKTVNVFVAFLYLYGVSG